MKGVKVFKYESQEEYDIAVYNFENSSWSDGWTEKISSDDKRTVFRDEKNHVYIMKLI